jgi:hypothetical protein
MRVFPPLTVASVAACAVAGLIAASCGDSGPVSSTPPTTLPQPSASPPPATGGDSFNHASCSIGQGDPDASCERKRERLLNVYEDSLDLLIEQRPEIFDLTSEAAPDTRSYLVKDKEAFLTGLVANARARGVCAERDPDDGEQETIRLKSVNDFSDDYDTMLPSGHVRRGMSAYKRSCTPSNFPVERTGDVPPIGSGCGRPYPPVVSRFNCKVHIKSPEYYTLDSTPLIGHNAEYCRAIGFTDGRTLCPVRPEGAEDREACENWRVGKAADTGRFGPTWRKQDGGFCTGKESGCGNHPSNQYGLLTYAPGTYTVSAANGAYCTVSH